MGVREFDKTGLAGRHATAGQQDAWNGLEDRARGKPCSRQRESLVGEVGLRGRVVPVGTITRVAGKERPQLSGPAPCVARGEAWRRGGDQGRHRVDETLVIRIQGPNGGSGMETMRATSPVHGGQGMSDEAAHVAGSRSSGVACGIRIGQIGHEAAVWEPTGADAGALGWQAGGDVLKMRQTEWQTLSIDLGGGGERTLAQFAGQACKGALAHP